MSSSSSRLASAGSQALRDAKSPPQRPQSLSQSMSQASISITASTCPFAFDFEPFLAADGSESSGFRTGGPKEARLKRVAFLSNAKEVDHLHTIKIKNIAETVSPEKLESEFSRFGEVGDVYIPKNLGIEKKKNYDFALVRFKDREAAERAKAEMTGTVINKRPVTVQEPNRPVPFFSNHTGALGITNEATEKPPPERKEFLQAIRLESCMSRNGYPWNSKRELKRLEPHAAPETRVLFSVRVDNLPPQLSTKEIEAEFSKFGRIGDVYCPMPLQVTLWKEQPNGGFAFVRFYERLGAEKAAREMNGVCVGGSDKPLCVRFLLPQHWPTEKTRRFY